MQNLPAVYKRPIKKPLLFYRPIYFLIFTHYFFSKPPQNKTIPMQNFKNHGRMVPMYHYVLFSLILAALIGSIINLYHVWHHADLHLGGALLVVISIILIPMALFSRSFALKAQDRAIRAEESLRHFALTGKLLDSRLRIGQIIALRFAPDEEFVGLAKKAVDENLDSKAIKQAIVNWKEDNYRV